MKILFKAAFHEGLMTNDEAENRIVEGFWRNSRREIMPNVARKILRRMVNSGDAIKIRYPELVSDLIEVRSIEHDDSQDDVDDRIDFNRLFGSKKNV